MHLAGVPILMRKRRRESQTPRTPWAAVALFGTSGSTLARGHAEPRPGAPGELSPSAANHSSYPSQMNDVGVGEGPAHTL